MIAGKRGGEDQADNDAEDRRPEQTDIGQCQRERQHAEDRPPDHAPRADAVADRAADHRAGGDGEEEQEQIKLRALHRETEGVDQVEDVEARDADEIEVLGEGQREQDGDRLPHLAVLSRGSISRAARRTDRLPNCPAVLPYQEPMPASSTMPISATDREPGEAPLAVRQHDEGCEQRTDARCRNCRRPGTPTGRGRGARPTRAAPRVRTLGETPKSPCRSARRRAAPAIARGKSQQQQPEQRGAPCRARANRAWGNGR